MSGTSTSAEADRTQRMNRGFFGHPVGLANLAGIEMWERFSFYGMQAILAYYLYYKVTDGGLGLPEDTAYSIVGAYGGAVYLSAVLGAWLSDRLFGAERTLTGAAVIIMCGHISLSLVPGFWGAGVGLLCIATGSGTLKATTSSVLGDMYGRDDPRRDGGFSIYYMGVNLGALVGPLLTGAIWGARGFHWGFALAAIGMALGLVQYLALRRKTLAGAGKGVSNPLDARGKVRYGLGAIAVIALIVVLVLVGAITAARLSKIIVGVTLTASVVLFIVMLTSSRIDRIERRRVLSFIPMFIASATFWALFQQQSTFIATYADEKLDRNVFGWQMPPTFVQSINPIFIIIFAGVFAAMWTKLGNRQPSTPVKFGLGTIIMGLAFLSFLPFTGGGPNSTPLLALVGILFLFTMAELLLSPVGQSLSTKLAPGAFHTQMIALFFLSIAVGTAGAGTLARFYSTANEVPYFVGIGSGSIIVGIIMLLIRPFVLRLMEGVR